MARTTPARGRILHSLKLDAIAAVTRPCQEHATMAIIKRAPGEDGGEPFAQLAKMDLSTAHGFAEILAADEARRQAWQADEVLWPLFDALRQSLSSIAGDDKLDPPTKLTRVQESVTQFIGALKDKWPDVAEAVDSIAKASPNGDRMAAFIKAGCAGDHGKETTMATDADKIAGLEKSLGTATADLATALAKIETLEKAAKMPDPDAMMEDAEGKPTKKGREFLAKHAPATGDEVLKVGDQTISKAAVGDAQFAFFKLQNDRMEKAEREARITKLEKRASDEFGGLPGTDLEKAMLLDHLASAPEDVRKAAEAILTAAQKNIGKAFERIGKGADAGGGGPGEDAIKKGRTDFAAKVEDIASRDKIDKAEAMSKARREFPDLYKAAYPPADEGEE